MADLILHDGIEFRTLDDWPGYAVSRCGKIASSRPKNGRGPRGGWRLLKQGSDVSGYLGVILCQGGGRLNRRNVHRLVLLAWAGPCPDGMQCRHLNGDSADNRLENLAWGTPRQNMGDRDSHERTVRGSRQWSAKLTEADIPVIRKLLGDGETKASIARKFGVTSSAIGHIYSGLNWSHVS